MSAQDEARAALHLAAGQIRDDGMDLSLADFCLTRTPDGWPYSIGEALDEWAVMRRVLRWMVAHGNADQMSDGAWATWLRASNAADVEMLAEVDPEAAALLARLEDTP